MVVIVILLFVFVANFKFSDNIRASVSIGGLAELKGTLVLPESKVQGVRLGQEVKVFLRAYPYIEYGTIEAEVSGIKSLPNKIGKNKFYLIELVFPTGLKTNKGLVINTATTLDVDAEIIIEKKSILEKILNEI